MPRTRSTWALVALVAPGALALAAPAIAQPTVQTAAQTSPVGVWNIRSRDMTDRATGGVRVVLLRVEEASGGYEAEITSIRNTFAPVDRVTLRGNELNVTYGSYEYALRVDGDELTGTVTSPLGTQDVEGLRQQRTLTYVGDEAEPFRTERPGVVGHRTQLDPPADAPDPAAWVRGRIVSVDDLALVVGRRAKVAVGFTNARAFEAELLALAGRPVTVVGVWVGDRLQIESIEPRTP